MRRLPAPGSQLSAWSLILALWVVSTSTAAPASSPSLRREPGAGSREPPLAVLTFNDAAEVTGRVIRLGDVAAVESADRRLATRLAGVAVGAAPPAGRSRGLSTESVRIGLRQTGVNPDRLQFEGPALVTVTRLDQAVAGAAIGAAACAAVQAGQSGARAEVAYAPAELRVPRGAVEVTATPGTPAPGTSAPPFTGTVPVPVRILVDGREEARVTVTVRLLRLTPTLVAARDLLAGTRLAEGDVRVEERPATSGTPPLNDAAQADGLQLSQPVRGGTVLTPSMLRPAVIIKRGSRVRLICRGPSFVATVSGEALQDGVAGGTIRVRNLASLLEVTGLPVDAQTVEVPF